MPSPFLTLHNFQASRLTHPVPTDPDASLGMLELLIPNADRLRREKVENASHYHVPADIDGYWIFKFQQGYRWSDQSHNPDKGPATFYFEKTLEDAEAFLWKSLPF